MEPKTGRRIVSKGKYISVQADRAIFRIVGIVAWLLTVLLTLVAVVFISALFMNILWGISVNGGIFCLLGAVVSGGGAYWCRRAGTELMKYAAIIDPGIPLTRANTADLPAPDSLVRASAEPVQTQETVLLRAAAAGQERHEEQLVRASMGGEESY